MALRGFKWLETDDTQSNYNQTEAKSGRTDEHHAPETTGTSYDQCGDGHNKRMMKDDATTDGDVQLSALSDEPFQSCSR